jgi:hypothetical protein
MHVFKTRYLIPILGLFLTTYGITTSTLSTDQYLTHFWPIFNGTMIDVIGSAHMTQGNLASFVQDRFGDVNSALALNGGWTQVPAGIYFNTPEFTISAWVYPSNVSSWTRIIDFANGCESHSITLVFSALTPNHPSLCLYTDSWYFVESSQSITLDRWQFFAATFNGTRARFYLNGNLTADLFFSYTLQNVLRSYCYIGKSNCHWDGYSNSYLDDLRFYNKSLTRNEIIELMINQNEISKYIFYLLARDSNPICVFCKTQNQTQL